MFPSVICLLEFVGWQSGSRDHGRNMAATAMKRESRAIAAGLSAVPDGTCRRTFGNLVHRPHRQAFALHGSPHPGVFRERRLDRPGSAHESSTPGGYGICTASAPPCPGGFRISGPNMKHPPLPCRFTAFGIASPPEQGQPTSSTGNCFGSPFPPMSVRHRLAVFRWTSVSEDRKSLRPSRGGCHGPASPHAAAAAGTQATHAWLKHFPMGFSMD